MTVNNLGRPALNGGDFPIVTSWRRGLTVLAGGCTNSWADGLILKPARKQSCIPWRVGRKISAVSQSAF